ncbi:uncharacterized protein LOC128960556 [Oppia nitens]|uniref:uncharacterized protein LOC128960556 n=1 Tax=Oppia nitens TaxID=1686743 RepID=UPI0023DAD91F|nr:uncharacterized protein LOC128960556 [Oppia nitens]
MGDNNRFNCPIDGCNYAINGGKYFKRQLFLNQHIANKHSEKKFICEKCHKKYAIEWQLKYHKKSCGVEWECGSCDKRYTERLSLVMHCKRRSHILPSIDGIKYTKNVIKNEVKVSPINIQTLIVMPVIFATNPMVTTTSANQTPIKILPKSYISDDELNYRSICTQTSTGEECNKCKSNMYQKTVVTNIVKFSSISTQTDRLTQRFHKTRESRSTDCQTIRKRNRKPQSAYNYESIETQTLESALHSNGSTNKIQISASTSTSPPKKTSKKIRLDIRDIENINKSCAFTQTSIESSINRVVNCNSDEQSFDANERQLSKMVQSFNPLIDLLDTTNTVILEQSVQTEANDLLLDNGFNNIETQTVNLDINENDLFNFDTNDEFVFTDLEFTDIETQTIWDNDRSTQTDEHLDRILQYLSHESSAVSDCDISDTIFSSTQTQTQTDFSLI